MGRSGLYTVRSDIETTPDDPAVERGRKWRVAVFLGIFLAVAGGGLIYDYTRPAVYRATSRLSVEPPGVDDPVARAQFAVSEAQALRRSDLMQLVAGKLKGPSSAAALDPSELERHFVAEAVPQTSVIELRGEGHDRTMLVAALSAWIEMYTASRKDTDRHDETEAADEARHAARVAQKAVDDKRREMEAFRKRHGITSIERDENPGTARLKGLHTALNDASTREVNAEAKLKATSDSIAQGQGAIRAADRAAIGNLDMRAVDLREKLKDLEHDYTAQYLAMDPKFKALKANLARVEQQIEQEKARSQKAALAEAQEEYAGAQRAAQRIREQAEALKQESQAFSTRFVELRRMATELEQLQESRRVAAERLGKLESARKPSAVRIRVLSAPAASEDPIAPNYSRDAAFALGGGFVLAIAAVWLMDFLRRDSKRADGTAAQPIIQIAYPVLQAHAGGASYAAIPAAAPAGLLGAMPGRPALREFAASDISALWASAPADGRLMLAAIFAGIAPAELTQLRWRHVDLDRGIVEILGTNARPLGLIEPLRQELAALATNRTDTASAETPLLADGAGNAMDEVAMDEQLVRIAHDAGLRHPEEATGQALHFTYAAFLARQGIRMVDLAAVAGRFTGVLGTELMRLAPSGHAVTIDRVERVYPSFHPSSGSRWIAG